jgi:hypothetical protein
VGGWYCIVGYGDGGGGGVRSSAREGGRGQHPKNPKPSAPARFRVCRVKRRRRVMEGGGRVVGTMWWWWWARAFECARGGWVLGQKPENERRGLGFRERRAGGLGFG